MKLITLSLVLLGAVSAHSATVAVSRGGLGVIAVTSAGQVLSGGGYYIGVGAYAAEPVVTDIASLKAAVASFTEFANAVSPAAAGNTQGTITGSFTGGLSNAAAFNSKEIYILVGNGATKDSSVDFAIIKGTPTWNYTADTSAADSISVIMRDVSSFSVIAGAGREVDVADVAAKDQLVLATTVPEVSGSLLLGLTALGMLRRRRR